MSDTLQAEIEAELAALTQEYAAWNTAQGLNLGPAHDHLFDETLTEEQRSWLMGFAERWDGASPVTTGGQLFRARDIC